MRFVPANDSLVFRRGLSGPRDATGRRRGGIAGRRTNQSPRSRLAACH